MQVILAPQGVEEREKSIVRKFRGKTLRNLEVSHVVGNPLSRTDVKASLMQCAQGASRGAVQRVVIVADRDWLAGPSTDKRTIFAAMLAESVCEDTGVVADSMVAEVVDRSLGQQVKATHPSVGYISSAELMALFTSQVVEHEDLNVCWRELLCVDGSEIYIKDARLYTSLNLQSTWRDLEESAQARSVFTTGHGPTTGVCRRTGCARVPPCCCETRHAAAACALLLLLRR